MTRRNGQGRQPCHRPADFYTFEDLWELVQEDDPEYPKLTLFDGQVRLQLGDIHFHEIPADPRDQLRLVYELAGMDWRENMGHVLTKTLELLARTTGWRLDVWGAPPINPKGP
jgi:hypothetical protein